MIRVALGIEYAGDELHGFQKQKNIPTVQFYLENALSNIANEKIMLHCAGRTDAGVHATGQVVHFDTHAKRHVEAFLWGANAKLPANIRIRWARQVDFHFHARFSAIGRSYRYIIYNHPVQSALFNKRVTWYYYPLDIHKMNLAAQYVLGEQDFSSFRSAECGANSPMRCVQFVKIIRAASFIVMDISANAFLHHMVRNIMGVLIKIGSSTLPPEWMQSVLLAKDRKCAAMTAPASGLYLTRVDYLLPYSFPQAELPQFF